MVRWLNSYFSFTKKELNGILILIFLILGVTILSFFYPLSGDTEEETISKEFAADIARFYASEEIRHSRNREYRGKKWADQEKVIKAIYFQFDPNELPEADWKRLGLSDKQIKGIKNYEAKGGRFRKKEDLKKMYTISAQKYAALEPYIFIKAGSQASASANHNRAERKASLRAALIEINTADSLQLEALRGIGSALAVRIIKYRQRLGGFYKMEQLREVYGIDSNRYSQLSDQIRVDANAINPININTAEFEELKRHPYLSYKQINAILQYRKQHGPYATIDDLRQIKIIDEGILSKIAPYFSFNDSR